MSKYREQKLIMIMSIINDKGESVEIKRSLPMEASKVLTVGKGGTRCYLDLPDMSIYNPSAKVSIDLYQLEPQVIEEAQSEAPSVVTVKEQLAAIEHERWSDWQKWCHEVLYKELGWSDRLEKVLERWKVQIETPYFELSEKEKQSDRDQVDRYWPLINRLIVQAKLNQLDELIDIESKQFMHWSQKDIAFFFKKVGRIYRELSNNLSKGEK